jgi:hypothetical protein
MLASSVFAVSGTIQRYGKNPTKEDSQRAIVEAFDELRVQHLDSGEGTPSPDRRVFDKRSEGTGPESGVAWSMPDEYRAQLEKLGIGSPDLVETTSGA